MNGQVEDSCLFVCSLLWFLFFECKFEIESSKSGAKRSEVSSPGESFCFSLSSSTDKLRRPTVCLSDSIHHQLTSPNRDGHLSLGLPNQSEASLGFGKLRGTFGAICLAFTDKTSSLD